MRAKFQNRYAVEELDKNKGATQAASLLHCAGIEAQKFFSNFVIIQDEDKQKVEDVSTKFKAYCEPKKDEIFATHKFWKRNHILGESQNNG